MARLYLLDTNAASDIMNRYSEAARQTLVRESRSSVIAISSITAGELRFGIKNRGSVRLQKAFDEFCAAAQIPPWDDTVAAAYGELRYRIRRKGKTLDAMDLLIAAHAFAVGAVLVTRDGAFEHVKDMVMVVNWATDLK